MGFSAVGWLADAHVAPTTSSLFWCCVPSLTEWTASILGFSAVGWLADAHAAPTTSSLFFSSFTPLITLSLGATSLAGFVLLCDAVRDFVAERTGTWTKHVLRYIAAFSPTRPLYLLLVFLFGKEALHLFSMGLALLDTSSHFLLSPPSTTSPSSNGLCCCMSLRSLDNSLLRPTSASLSWTTKVSCRISSKRMRHFFPSLFLKKEWVDLIGIGVSGRGRTFSFEHSLGFFDSGSSDCTDSSDCSGLSDCSGS